MSRHRFLAFIILIRIYLIQSEITQFNCTRDEEHLPCEGIEVVTCKTRQALNFGNCKHSRCICPDKGFVLNDEGDCVPLWKCPTVCPRNSVFNFCGNYRGDMSVEYPLTGTEYRDECEPKCLCLRGHLWNSKRQECEPAEDIIVGPYALVREMRWDKSNRKFIGICGKYETMVCNSNSVLPQCKFPGGCNPQLCGAYCICNENCIRNFNGFCAPTQI